MAKSRLDGIEGEAIALLSLSIRMALSIRRALSIRMKAVPSGCLTNIVSSRVSLNVAQKKLDWKTDVS